MNARTKALVVYESMFGNTEAVAEAIASGLATTMDVELHEATKAPRPVTEFLDLVVVGGPTHAFSMSRPNTREDAIRQGAQHRADEIGIREWLEALHAGPHSELVATFDTKVDKVRRLPGSAAKKAAKVVHNLGYESAAKAESFYVHDVDGPLLDGELDRAKAWGERRGSEAEARAHGRAQGHALH